MTASRHAHPSPSDWMGAKSLQPDALKAMEGPQCALVPVSDAQSDHIAVVYPGGETPPEITI
ncbi:MAG: hypothetical protein AAF744_15370, partial [Pseudomonadota bacterium]